MNRLAMLPLVIIASCLYSCSPKIGESTSASTTNSNASSISTSTNPQRTTTQPVTELSTGTGTNEVHVSPAAQ
jgi:hypothetical protein